MEAAFYRIIAPRFSVSFAMISAIRRRSPRPPSVAAAAILLAITALAVPRGTSGQPPAWRTRADAVFAGWNRPDSPGCALGVFQNGRMAYERGYGAADLEQGVPITPETVFYVGSVSKQFTAAAAALAIEEGRLSADDSIRKYLPELPEYANRITVSHLVHHTSGLRDYNTLLTIAGRRGDEAYDNATVLRIMARQKHPNFAAGEEYLYSNSGYTLLASVVARATGVPFAEYAERHIFGPLQMGVTHFHVDAGRLIKRRAYAYAPGAAGAWRLDTPSNERAGAGGVYTHVRDLLKWDENFYAARVGTAALIRRLETPGSLNSGKRLDYAWGLQIGAYRGQRMVEHSGSLGGYRAHLIRFPDQHLSVAALCNLGTITPGTLVRDVADAVLGAAFTQPRPAAAGGGGAGGAATGPDRPVEAPAQYAGAYYSDEVDATFHVSHENGALRLRRDADTEAAPLQPAGETFRFRGMTVRFERDASRIVALVVDAGRVRDIRFVRARD